MSGCLELYWDEDGQPRAGVAAWVPVAARFLETDLQGDAALTAELLARVSELGTGRRSYDRFVGNAHVLELSPVGARLECPFDPAVESVELPLDALRGLLAGWLALLED